MATPTEARAPTMADLPRLAQPLPATFAGSYGLCMGEILWIDLKELVLWTAEPLTAGRELAGRIDFKRGSCIDVGLSVVEGEPIAKHRNGMVQVLRWSARGTDAASRAPDAVKHVNPAAFVAGYRAPRLPTDSAAGDQAAVAVSSAIIVKPTRRLPVVPLIALGLVLTLGLGYTYADMDALRLRVYQYSPGIALDYGLFEGANFGGTDFSGAHLVGGNFTGSRLDGANFKGANLEGAALTSANLGKTDFTEANLTNADLSGAYLLDANFAGANLSGATLPPQLDGARWFGARYSANTRWSGSPIPAGAFGPGASLEGLDFTSANLESVDLSGAHAARANFTEAKLAGARLERADLQGAQARRADFSAADLSKANAQTFNGEGADFSGATIEALFASRSLLSGANLSKTTGTSPDFSKAVLADANLEGAVWKRADLRGAIFTRAKLAGAKLNESLLLGSDLSGARLDDVVLDGAIADATTRWPLGTVPAELGVRVVGPNAVLPDLTFSPGVRLNGLDLGSLRADRISAPKADFGGSKLDSAVLIAGDLAGASFAGASLRQTNLSTAKLDGANFGAADLTGAIFDGALLCGADFAGAILQGTSFTGAVQCEKTRWPNGEVPSGLHTQ